MVEARDPGVCRFGSLVSNVSSQSSALESVIREVVARTSRHAEGSEHTGRKRKQCVVQAQSVNIPANEGEEASTQ